MLVLGLDTALDACSLAILKRGERAGDKFLPISQGHAEHLAPLARELFDEAGVSPAALDRIGVVVGPGQFAGVRIGLAFAEGLALGGRALVLGVSSLESLAASLAEDWPQGALRAAVVDARRGAVYAALYAARGNAVLAPFLSTIAEADERIARAADGAPLRLVGSGAGLLAGGSGRSVAPLRDIDPYAVARLVAVADPALYPPTPLYLRAPDATPAAPSRFAQSRLDNQ